MTITGGTALSKEEIDRMVKEAEAFAAEDHKRRETAEAHNQADQLSYSVEKDLAEWGEKVPESDRDELKKLNDELKDLLKAEDADAEKLRPATDAVLQVYQRVGTAIHQQAQEQAQPESGEAPADAPETESEDDVVEGEIVDEGGAS
jgi:molecular chaperone DnaK